MGEGGGGVGGKQWNGNVRRETQGDVNSGVKARRKSFLTFELINCHLYAEFYKYILKISRCVTESGYDSPCI